MSAAGTWHWSAYALRINVVIISTALQIEPVLSTGTCKARPTVFQVGYGVSAAAGFFSL